MRTPPHERRVDEWVGTMRFADESLVTNADDIAVRVRLEYSSASTASTPASMGLTPDGATGTRSTDS